MAPQDKTNTDDFENAFNEGAPEAVTQTEDEAFGITPSDDDTAAQPAEDAAPASGAPAAVTMVDENEGTSETDDAAAAARAANEANNEGAGNTAGGSESTATSEAGGASEDTPAATDATAAAGEDDMGLDDTSDVPPEDMQKFKSWQGRLKKIEADLKAKLAAGGAPATPDAAADQASDAISEVASDASASGDTALASAATEVADQVDAGEITPEQAMKQLAEDFGEDFVRLIEIVARGTATKYADEKVGAVSKDVEGLIENLTNERERAHFEAIYDAHPDFVEVSKDPAFTEFVSASGKQDVADRGNAKQINALISEFKSSKEVDPGDTPNGEPVVEAAAPASTGTPAQDAVVAAQDSVSDDEVDAAEGVRSTGGGLRLPEKPTEDADDYLAAWDKA